MSQYFDFSMTTEGLENVHFLTLRHSLQVNGDIESGFLNQAIGIKQHGTGSSFSHIVATVLQRTEAAVLVVIRNPDLLLDDALSTRIKNCLKSLPPDDGWSLAGAGGLGLGEKRHLALYASAKPAIPERGDQRPLLDLMPDLYLANTGHLSRVLSKPHSAFDAGFEPAMVAEGYLDNRIALFLPELTAGINGDLSARDMIHLTAELTAQFAARLPGQRIPTLAGSISIAQPSEQRLQCSAHSGALVLAESVASVVARFSDPISLSIVTRTRFDRPYLLRRLLSSISRARRPGMDLEIILTTDLPEAEANAAFNDIKPGFVNIDLRLCHNSRGAHSRVTNLIGGIGAARNDYVLVMDDDDYVDIFAFDALAPAFFRGSRPLIVTSSQTHEEVWEVSGCGRAVLSHSAPVKPYPASGWRQMFSGVNALPICGLVMPRAFLIERLKAFDFTHDLSEDYALSLLLLTAPDLPPVHEVPDIFAHISLRGQENSVTMVDRRPWVRDISGYLTALTDNARVAGPGVWALLAEHAALDDQLTSRSIEDLRHSLDRRERGLKILQHENARLRAEISILQEPVQ